MNKHLFSSYNFNTSSYNASSYTNKHNGSKRVAHVNECMCVWGEEEERREIGERGRTSDHVAQGSRPQG